MKDLLPRILKITLFVVSTAGCSSVQGYPGDKIPAEEVGTIVGYNSICTGSLKFLAVDGRYSGYRIDLKPGSHRFSVEYRSEPFLDDSENKPRDFIPCSMVAAFTVELSTDAGKTYWFSVDQQRYTLQVYSAPEIADGGEAVDATITQTSLSKDCRQQSLYWRCISEESGESPWWR